MRVVRKVLVLSYEGEDVLVLALTFAKVPRMGSRKLYFFPRKFCVACYQEAGVMNHVYLPAVQEYAAAKATPSQQKPASENFKTIGTN